MHAHIHTHISEYVHILNDEKLFIINLIFQVFMYDFIERLLRFFPWEFTSFLFELFDTNSPILSFKQHISESQLFPIFSDYVVG